MSKNKIVISEFDNIAALFEGDLAVEFIIQRGDILLGDVFLAEVENILPSIDAAFVNVGGDKMGFLHSSDVPGKGDLRQRLQPKQQVVVQVMKEPTGHKGPRVTTNVSLPGRFLVMMPESKGISISRKIMESKERSRLKSIVSLLKPAGVGVIIRTEALGQSDNDIQEDLETLIERWQNIVSMADTAKPPTLLYRDQDLLYRVIREAVGTEDTEIIVDTNFGLTRGQQLLQNWNISKGVKISLHQGQHSILTATGVDKEIRQALQTKVPLPSGGYLYIQPTEALTVIDVNSGKFVSLNSQAETIKLTNLESAKEIARQLRLRNIGGMIIVDFIDMESRADQLSVLEAFENEMAKDKAKPQIGQLSDLGLVEMTRHRQGQSLAEIFTNRCQSCVGTGHAIDEFQWAPINIHGDPKVARPQVRKLPTKHSRHQNVPRPGASAHNQRNDRGVGGQMVDRQQQQQQGGNRQQQQQQQRMSPHQQREEQRRLAEITKNMFYNRPPEPEHRIKSQGHKSLAEQFAEAIEKQFGVKFANCGKVARLPHMANSILSRINPRATDVLSLVESMERAASMPDYQQHASSGSYDDGDDQDNDDGIDLQDPSLFDSNDDSNGRNDDSDIVEGEVLSEREAVAVAVESRPEVLAAVVDKDNPFDPDSYDADMLSDTDDNGEEASGDSTNTAADADSKKTAPRRRGRPPAKRGGRSRGPRRK